MQQFYCVDKPMVITQLPQFLLITFGKYIYMFVESPIPENKVLKISYLTAVFERIMVLDMVFLWYIWTST